MTHDARHLYEREAIASIVAPFAKAMTRDCRCPWCGSDPALPERSFGGALYSVSCSNDECPAHPTVEGRTPEEAMARWNERRS